MKVKLKLTTDTDSCIITVEGNTDIVQQTADELLAQDGVEFLSAER